MVLCPCRQFMKLFRYRVTQRERDEQMKVKHAHSYWRHDSVLGKPEGPLLHGKLQVCVPGSPRAMAPYTVLKVLPKNSCRCALFSFLGNCTAKI